MSTQQVLTGNGIQTSQVQIATGGGAISNGLPIEQAGIPIGTATILNFFGGGVSVAQHIGNPNQIDVDISGGGGGTVSGSGTAGQVAFWNGSASITSNSGFLYDGTNATIAADLTVGTQITTPLVLGSAVAAGALTLRANSTATVGKVQIATSSAGPIASFEDDLSTGFTLSGLLLLDPRAAGEVAIQSDVDVGLLITPRQASGSNTGALMNIHGGPGGASGGNGGDLLFNGGNAHGGNGNGGNVSIVGGPGIGSGIPGGIFIGDGQTASVIIGASITPTIIQGSASFASFADWTGIATPGTNPAASAARLYYGAGDAGFFYLDSGGTVHSLTTGGITALTGDGTATGPGSAALTLATVNTNVGSFGDATHVGAFTVNAKGLITAASSVAITFPTVPTGASPTAVVGVTAVNGTATTYMRSDAAPAISTSLFANSTTLASAIVSSSLTSVGTVTTGTWNATTIAIAHGGTGSTTQNFVDLTTTQSSIGGSKTFTAPVIATTYSPPTAIAALNLDWSTSNMFSKSISGNSTFTFSNTQSGQTIVFQLTTTGSFTATFPAGIKWPGGAQPTQTASGTDVYTFVDFGGTISASVVQALA